MWLYILPVPQVVCINSWPILHIFSPSFFFLGAQTICKLLLLDIFNETLVSVKKKKKRLQRQIWENFKSTFKSTFSMKLQTKRFNLLPFTLLQEEDVSNPTPLYSCICQWTTWKQTNKQKNGDEITKVSIFEKEEITMFGGRHSFFFLMFPFYFWFLE